MSFRITSIKKIRIFTSWSCLPDPRLKLRSYFLCPGSWPWYSIMILIYRQVYNAFRWQVMMFLCGADDSLLMRKLKFHPFAFSINWCFKAMDCMQENWGKQKSSHFLKMWANHDSAKKIMPIHVHHIAIYRRITRTWNSRWNRTLQIHLKAMLLLESTSKDHEPPSN